MANIESTYLLLKYYYYNNNKLAISQDKNASAKRQKVTQEEKTLTR